MYIWISFKFKNFVKTSTILTQITKTCTCTKIEYDGIDFKVSFFQLKSSNLGQATHSRFLALRNNLIENKISILKCL
jgi:hypothetical protein